MRINQGSRIVIDTNVWISFLIGKYVEDLEQKILEKNLVVLYSPALLTEIEEVLARPKFRKYFHERELDIIIEIFKTTGEKIQVKSKVNACRDAKDNFLLALCKDGKANYLISRDLDLIDLKIFENTHIVNYRTFIE